jgi:hypothetical protein
MRSCAVLETAANGYALYCGVISFAGWQAVVIEAGQGPATLLAGCGNKANDLAEASVRFASEVSESGVRTRSALNDTLS